MAATVQQVTSRGNALVVRLRKLIHDPAGYRKAGEVWIEGVHLCSALLQHGHRPGTAVVTEAGWSEPSVRALAVAASAVAIVDAALMAHLSGLESAAPIGFVWAGPAPMAIASGRPSVVLDRLQDAGNVGNLLRSAAAFGFEQVVALRGTAALWSPKVLRAGMGAHFGLRLIEAADVAALASLQVPLIATSSHASAALHEAELPWPCAWVLGHEGQGVAAAIGALCERTVRIPQPGGEESLNVAAAGAVCFYESARRRSAPG